MTSKWSPRIHSSYKSHAIIILTSAVVIFLKCKLPFSYRNNVYCIGYFYVIVQNTTIKSNLQNKDLIWVFCSRETRIMLPSWLGSMTARSSHSVWSRELRGSTHLQLQCKVEEITGKYVKAFLQWHTSSSKAAHSRSCKTALTVKQMFKNMCSIRERFSFKSSHLTIALSKKQIVIINKTH